MVLANSDIYQAVRQDQLLLQIQEAQCCPSHPVFLPDL